MQKIQEGLASVSMSTAKTFVWTQMSSWGSLIVAGGNTSACCLLLILFLGQAQKSSSLFCPTHLVQKLPLLRLLPRVDRRSSLPREIASRLVRRECCLCWAAMGCFGVAFYSSRNGSDRQPCVLCSGSCGLSSFLEL